MTDRKQITNSLGAIKENGPVVIISHSLSRMIDSGGICTLKGERVGNAGVHCERHDRGGTNAEISRSRRR